MRRNGLVLAAFTLLHACSGAAGGGGGDFDGGTDAPGQDGTADVTADVVLDREMDVARDTTIVDAAAMDGAPDTTDTPTPMDGPDASIDVSAADATVEAAMEAAVDVAVDRTSDAADVAPADVVPADGGRVFPAGITVPSPIATPPERRVTCGVTPRAATVMAGVADRVVLRGRIVTPTGVLSPGEVLVSGGTITCVASSCASRTGYAGATVIDTGGVVYPGLVNTHDHPQYDFIPPWTPPMLYPDADAWQRAPAYRTATEVLRNNEMAHTCAMLKWGELRGLVAGVTSTQGVLNRTCATRTLARNVEYGADFMGVDTHRTNTLGIASVTAADAVTLRAAIDGGTVTAYILHLSEGVDDVAWREWGMLLTRDLLTPALVAIHGTALGRDEFSRMAATRAKLVWSPRSNLVLYGRTTDVGAALDAGVTVALAPDWTLTGSANLLEEMRYAREVSRVALGGRLTSRVIFEMATSTAARVVDRAQVGSLREGGYADIMVVPDRGCDAYDTLLDAPVADVRLVMVGGRVMYGDAAVVDALPAAARARCEPLAVCGMEKRACVALSDTTNELDRTLAQVEAELRAFTTPFPLVPRCPP